MNNGTLTVAPVTPITDKQPTPACNFTVHVTLDGFPIEISGQGKADDLRALVARLKAIGAEPPAAMPAKTEKSAPVCPEHGTAKPSKKPGSYYCPKSLPDGGYCRWTGKA